MKPLTHADLEYVQLHARIPLLELKGAHILVTGANGFIGSWLADCLANSPPHLTVTRATRTSHGDVRAITIPKHITHIIHTASAGKPSDTPTAVCATITSGTRRVLNEAARSRAKVLHLSSASVYLSGDHPDENAPRRALSGTTPADWIALAKRRAEDLALEQHATVARISALLGPRLPPQFAAAEFMRNAIANKPSTVQQPATIRSYLYAADLTIILLHILAFGSPANPYNVGASLPTSIGTLALSIAHAANAPPPLIAENPTPAPPLIPNTTRVSAFLPRSYEHLPLTDAIALWLNHQRA